MTNSNIESTHTVSKEMEAEMLNALTDLLVRQTEACLANQHDFAELYADAFLQEYQAAASWTASPEIAQTAVGARLLEEIEWSRLILMNDFELIECDAPDDVGTDGDAS